MSTKGITVDDAFLKDFLARGGVAHTQGGTPVKPSSGRTEIAETPTEMLETGRTAIAEKPTELHERAEEAKEQSSNPDKKQEARDAKQQEREQREAEARQQAQQTAIKNAVNDAIEPLKATADRVASFRTTGGIGLLLFVLAILLFTVVQVDKQGNTRMKQLWYMLNGRARLQGRVQEQPIQVTLPSQEQQIQQFSKAVTQTGADIGTAVSQAATHLATGSVTDFIASLGNEFGQAFRSTIGG